MTDKASDRMSAQHTPKQISSHYIEGIKPGAHVEGGTFAGLITLPDGRHVAVILLPNKAQELNWKAAKAWAAEINAQLPSRPIAALLYANVKSHLEPRWHWTSDEESASSAWNCRFDGGYQYGHHKSYEGCAVAVRCIPLTA